MRICILKATKQIIEMQSCATAGTLIRNAINGGHKLEEVEEREVTESEYESAKAECPVEIKMREQSRAIAITRAAKDQSITDNLPSWQAVSDAIDAATTLAACKIIIKKLARVVYWIAKNKAE